MPRWQWAQDGALSLALALVGLVGTGRAFENQPAAREPDLWAYALVLVAAAALAIRRQIPVAALAGNAVAVVTYLAVGYPFGPIMLTIPVIAYAAGGQLSLRRTSVLVGAYAAAVVAAGFLRPSQDRVDGGWLAVIGQLAAILALFAAPAAIGAAVRIRREARAGVRAEQAQRAVSEERLRMAQELHDSVGHGLAVIAMQAGVGLHVLDQHPARAREALEAIRDTSRESLDGLRAQLQVLRDPDGDLAPRRPAPGLADLDVLVDRIRSGGLEVRADVASVQELATSVDQAAYRIVQESLTNVLRHARARRADVSIRQGEKELLIEVTDDGTTTSAATLTQSPGGGIAGMRGRAEALGGTLDAGPRPGGGFAVRARLPLAGRPADDAVDEGGSRP